MVLLPTQNELVALYKEHKKHIVCPRCLQKGRFQRDGFKDGKIRFTCSTAGATTDKTKPAKCNKHYTEAVMEQLLLQVIAKETRKAYMKLGGVGRQALGGSATPTKTAVEAIKATTTRSRERVASAKRSDKTSSSTSAPKTTSIASREEATMTAKRAAQTATKDYIRQALLSDRHFIQSSIELAQCSEKAFLKDPQIILREKGSGGGGGGGGGNRGDDDVFEFVMTEGRFQDWMESHARLTGVQFSQDREQVYNQPKSGGMYRGMFWYKHRCSHSERPKNRAALAPQSRSQAKKPVSAGAAIATAVEPNKQDDGDGESDDSDTDKEMTVGSDIAGGVGGRSLPNRSGCRASIQEALQSYRLPDGMKTTVHVVKYRFRHGHALGFRTRGPLEETGYRMDDAQMKAEKTKGRTGATRTMTITTTKARTKSGTKAVVGSDVGRRKTRSQTVLGFILPPSVTETAASSDQQLKDAPFLYPSPVSEPSGQSLGENDHFNSPSNNSSAGVCEEVREGSPLPGLRESFSTLSGSLPDELQQFTVSWEEALEDLEKNPMMPNAHMLQEELIQVLTILRREIGENVQLDKLEQRVVRLERLKELKIARTEHEIIPEQGDLAEKFKNYKKYIVCTKCTEFGRYQNGDIKGAGGGEAQFQVQQSHIGGCGGRAPCPGHWEPQQYEQQLQQQRRIKFTPRFLFGFSRCQSHQWYRTATENDAALTDQTN
ncbi:hypothetical protein BGZ96_011515 [Linnemannia gamsii]|uniref:Uncharacterized protein n=1 Tax=Linnemannia gamsii TaxID=64522 RepID=A0ABQ7JSA7_9FUNG|nr:hypothetical protein BGZ96_011515 [Linnemannia gamsii]